MYILIKNQSKQFKLDAKPHEGQILRLREEVSTPDKFFRITLVENIPLGLSGVFSYQVSLVEIPSRKKTNRMEQLSPVTVKDYTT